jgi:hypothetical protein
MNPFIPLHPKLTLTGGGTDTSTRPLARKSTKTRRGPRHGITFKRTRPPAHQIGGSDIMASLASAFGLKNMSNKLNFKQFLAMYSKELVRLNRKVKHFESIVAIYKKYCDRRIQFITEIVICYKAIEIYPKLKEKIVTMAKKEKDAPKQLDYKKQEKAAKEFVSQIAQIDTKLKEIAAKKKSLEIEDKSIYKQLAQQQADYKREFKKVTKYMTETDRIGKYYAEKVAGYVTKLELLHAEYTEYMKEPATERSAAAKRVISKYNANKKAYDAIIAAGAASKMDELARTRDKLMKLRNDAEHYNNEIIGISPKELDDKWRGYIRRTTELIILCAGKVDATKRHLDAIKKSVVRLNELVATQQYVAYMKIYEDFLIPVDKSIQLLGFIATQIGDIERNFYNITPARNLNYNIQQILQGVRTIYVILKGKVIAHINSSDSNLKKLAGDKSTLEIDREFK